MSCSGLSRLNHRQKEIIRRVSGALRFWQLVEYQRLGTDMIDEAADIAALDEGRQLRATTDCSLRGQRFAR